MSKLKLSELATLTLSNVDKKSKDSEIPIKLCNYSDIYNNWAITKNMIPTFMDATAKENEIEKFKLKRGYVALTKDSETKNDIGIASYISEELTNTLLGYHCALIKPKPNKLDGKYLNSLLHTKYAQKYFEFNASGSGQRFTLSIDDISNFSFDFPDIKKQEKVGSVFSNIDKKIQNNLRINSVINQVTSLIYDYWFLQFDFPNENGNPYKSSGGKMIYNSLLEREVPEKWVITQLADECEICLGGTPSTEKTEYWNGDIPWLNSGEIAKFPIVESEKKITQLGVDKSAAKVMKEGSIVISITGNIRCSILGFDSTANQSVVGVFESEGLRREYLYQYMNNLLNRYTVISGGNCQRHINKAEVERTAILIPPSSVLNKYYELVESMYKQLVLNSKENLELIKLRDFLLPLLFSGQAMI